MDAGGSVGEREADPGVDVKICLGFDGSDSDDWTAIRAETFDGWQFTPTYGPDKVPTIWNPADHGGKIPRLLVHAAVDELFRQHEVGRMYCDPRDWQTEIETWGLEHGDKIVAEWPTNQIVRMHAALERFKTDLSTGTLTHDGCPTTTAHMENARKFARPAERYIIGKPEGAYHQKIDVCVASVVCHEAACDARAAGWGHDTDSYAYVM